MPPTSLPTSITGSVGFGGRNQPADVTAVQSLLNAKLPAPLPALKTDGACGPKTVAAIREYQKRAMNVQSPDGVIAPDGMTLRSLTGVAASAHVPPSSAAGHKYTNSPFEVVATRTTPTAKEVIKALRAAWPQLSEQGARTLTAQFMTETGHGKYCFNWNLGNVKAKEDQTHMYLKNVWECLGASKAKRAVTDGHSLAREAKADEIKKHGWKGDGTVIVFDPPHPQCRFRAYATLAEGAAKWIDHHQKIARSNASYLGSLNAGKVEAVAQALKQAHYFTASEAAYASAMAKNKAEIDRVSGAS